MDTGAALKRASAWLFASNVLLAAFLMTLSSVSGSTASARKCRNLPRPLEGPINSISPLQVWNDFAVEDHDDVIYQPRLDLPTGSSGLSVECRSPCIISKGSFPE